MEFSEKCRLIEEIKNEVGELHPLLENIFPKLPNIKSHEYTHGQFERGADFLLEIENSTTGRRSHVGVVVKCGKIGSAKVPELEEQIKECAEERAYKIMRRVRCAEVWVFASGGYSERTKEKLLARFPGRSVEFFDQEDIAKFVDDHYSYFWHDLPYELGSYLQQLGQRIELIDKGAGINTIGGSNGIYIELDTYEKITNTYLKNSPRKHSIRNIEFIHEALRSKIGLLEADMGFGKSKLMRRLAISLCSADSFLKTKTIPVFSTFRLFLDKHSGCLIQLVDSALGKAIKNLDDPATQVLVILDGIDECSQPQQTSVDLFEKLAGQAKGLSQYKVIVSTRPLKSLVDKALLYNEARIFGIRPLSLPKIVKYLEDTCTKKNLPARLFEDLKKSPLFKQLPQSPIAAALFSNLLSQSQQEVPQSLTELYSKSMELMLGRWEQAKELATEKQFKTAQLIAEQLATYYVENRLIYVSSDEIDQIICTYLSKRNTGVNKEIVKTLLFDRSNIFCIDQESGTISFRHRSFAEFLCAQRKARDRSLPVENVALDPYWINVFFFYAGTLLDCTDLLCELRSVKANNEIQEWMKIVSVPNYLLAAYQTEFDEVESNLLVVLLESARLFLRVKSGDTKTMLSNLTHMQLLYLFKSLIVDSLGYDFFSRAFDPTALRIDEQLEDNEVKGYALFFLGCAALECGSDSVFKFLVKTVGAKSLPLSVSLAIQCELEAKTNLDKSGLLKFHKDKLRQLLQPSKKSPVESLSTQARINDLFDKPLSAAIKVKNR